MISDKTGSIYSVISIMGTVLLVLAFVFMFVLGGGILKDTSGQIFDEVRSIGNITPGVNVSEQADHVFNPVESVLDNFGLYGAMLYILGIVLIFTLAYTFRDNVSGLTLALFVVAALLIIIMAVILSNTYEVFYTDASFINGELQDMSLVSYLILYSPTILTIVIFIAGIILMTGKENPYA